MGEDAGHKIVELLGKGAAGELLEILERPERERWPLIARLVRRSDAGWLANVMNEIETDPDDLTRLRLLDLLRAALDET